MPINGGRGGAGAIGTTVRWIEWKRKLSGSYRSLSGIYSSPSGLSTYALLQVRKIATRATNGKISHPIGTRPSPVLRRMAMQHLGSMTSSRTVVVACGTVWSCLFTTWAEVIGKVKL